MTDFSDIASCSAIDPMMAVVRMSETSVDLKETTRRDKACRRENLKYHSRLCG